MYTDSWASFRGLMLCCRLGQLKMTDRAVQKLQRSSPGFAASGATGLILTTVGRPVQMGQNSWRPLCRDNTLKALLLLPRELTGQCIVEHWIAIALWSTCPDWLMFCYPDWVLIPPFSLILVLITGPWAVSSEDWKLPPQNHLHSYIGVTTEPGI